MSALEQALEQVFPGWAVLREIEVDGFGSAWELVSIDAGHGGPRSAEEALNSTLADHAAAGDPAPPDRWVAVPAAYWRPAKLELRTHYALVSAP